MSGSVEGDRPRRGRARSWLSATLRILVSVVLLVWLMRNLQGGLSRLEEIDPRALAPAALVFIFSTIGGALQWALLIRHCGVELSLGRLARLYWIGLFFNNFLPSNVGGDVVKVADVSWSTGGVAPAVAATVLDRVLGLIALAGLGLVAALVLGGPRPAGLPVGWLIVGMAALSAVVALLLSARLGRLLVRMLSVLRIARLGERVQSLWNRFEDFRRPRWFLPSVFLLAVAVQTLRVLTHVMVAQALAIPLDRTTVLGLYVLIPVLGAAIVLPVTFNGLGLREFIATRLLPGIGIAAPEAFALQITTYLVQLAVSTVGGLFFVLRLWRGHREGGTAEPPQE